MLEKVILKTTTIPKRAQIRPNNIQTTIKNPCRNLMRKMCHQGSVRNLTLLQNYCKSKTPQEGACEENLLNKKTCWQGTTSQGKHALGAFGPGADRSACGKVPDVALVRCSSLTQVFAAVLKMLYKFGCRNVTKTTKREPTGCKREPKGA